MNLFKINVFDVFGFDVFINRFELILRTIPKFSIYNLLFLFSLCACVCMCVCVCVFVCVFVCILSALGNSCCFGENSYKLMKVRFWQCQWFLTTLKNRFLRISLFKQLCNTLKISTSTSLLPKDTQSSVILRMIYMSRKVPVVLYLLKINDHREISQTFTKHARKNLR